MPIRFVKRPGTTLVELMIFVVLIAIIIGAVLPLLFMAAEDRLLQQTISVVEQNGAQILQNVTQRVRNAERILSPAMGETGSVLALQSASGATNPIIIGFNSGAVLVIEKTTQLTVTSSQVAVSNFMIRNTSTSTSRQSVEISFRVSRVTRLQQPHYYIQDFQTNISLFADDLLQGSNAQCAVPFCYPDNTFNWQIYNTALGQCLEGSVPMKCP